MVGYDYLSGMSDLTFDRLTYVDKLKSVGVKDDVARAHSDALQAALKDTVATKSDLKALKSELLMWLFPMLLGQAALVAALVKLL